MRDILIFGWGVVVGAGGLYALFALYRWVGSLSSRVQSLRMELSHYTIDRELWYEFQDWKRMNRKEKI